MLKKITGSKSPVFKAFFVLVRPTLFIHYLFTARAFLFSVNNFDVQLFLALVKSLFLLSPAGARAWNSEYSTVRWHQLTRYLRHVIRHIIGLFNVHLTVHIDPHYFGNAAFLNPNRDCGQHLYVVVHQAVRPLRMAMSTREGVYGTRIGYDGLATSHLIQPTSTWWTALMVIWMCSFSKNTACPERATTRFPWCAGSLHEMRTGWGNLDCSVRLLRPTISSFLLWITFDRYQFFPLVRLWMNAVLDSAFRPLPARTLSFLCSNKCFPFNYLALTKIVDR